jgi:hypothetical protein
MDRVPRPGACHPAALIPLLAWMALATQAWGQDQRPRFQAGVDITSVDVSVVDSDGRPVQGLTAPDFNVRVGGDSRRVVTADWVPLTATVDRGGGGAAIPDTFTSNLNAPPGRIILIAIDQQNSRFGRAIPGRDALSAFVDRLQPSDRIGLMILGRGGQSVPFTANRQILTEALARVAGQKIVQSAFRHQIAMWEALAIHQDDNQVYRSVVMRECGLDQAASGGGRSSNSANVCPSEVDAQARSMAANAIDDGERMLNALRAYFEGMRRADAPKSLVLVTEGFILDPQRPSFVELERLAAAARTSVYAATTAKDLAARALASPLGSSAVPIRVAAFAFGGQERGKVQIAVRAEIGEGHSSPVSMVVGYLLLGVDGKIVDSRVVERELRPLTDGVPSPLQFATTISVDPGEYLLRVAATDGRRAGSAERKVAARLHEAGSLRTSDLVAGRPVYATAPLQPTITSTVAFGNLHAYVEAYGASAVGTTVVFEVAQELDRPALLAAKALVRPAGGDRVIFSRVSSVRRIPPGRYVLRAIATGKGCQASGSGSEACTLATDFVIPANPASRDEIFLPVADERLTALFAPATESAAGGDERGGMEQRVNALVANRQLGAARELLEQWAAKCPDDVRVAKPLALLSATFGRPVEAVRLLQRHIAAYPDDVDAPGLGVEWLYGLHASGVSTSSTAGDLGFARRYAASYMEKNGPERPLVQLWLEFMSSSP